MAGQERGRLTGQRANLSKQLSSQIIDSSNRQLLTQENAKRFRRREFYFNLTLNDSADK